MTNDCTSIFVYLPSHADSKKTRHYLDRLLKTLIDWNIFLMVNFDFENQKKVMVMATFAMAPKLMMEGEKLMNLIVGRKQLVDDRC